jgi:hypothetical protein
MNCFHEIKIENEETIKYTYFCEKFLKRNINPLIIGPKETGKTTIIYFL